MTHRPASPLERLIALLALDPLDTDLFLAATPRGEGRLFGGLVAAQAVTAAQQSVEGRALHSLHAYFLRPGRHGTPIRLVVHRIRDGRSFTTRRVVAHQSGEAIFSLAASFARPEEGIAHQSPAPEAPPPDGLPDWEQLRAERLGDPAGARIAAPIEVRVCDPDPADGSPAPPRRRVWMRPCGDPGDDPRLHEALLVYATDRTLLGTAARPHGLSWGQRSVASLDHAVWLHQPARFDDWVLYASESPVAAHARGLVFGALYDRGGVRVGSVAQEGLIRVPQGRAIPR